MRDALAKDSRIHRDISLGNIILVKVPDHSARQGYLIDWEASCTVDDVGEALEVGRAVKSTLDNFFDEKMPFGPGITHELEQGNRCVQVLPSYVEDETPSPLLFPTPHSPPLPSPGPSSNHGGRTLRKRPLRVSNDDARGMKRAREGVPGSSGSRHSVRLEEKMKREAREKREKEAEKKRKESGSGEVSAGSSGQVKEREGGPEADCGHWIHIQRTRAWTRNFGIRQEIVGQIG
ncbi:hypothetical protein LXA43DRAFT_1059945 [Ganoderma leucocontextum]|nr:hypothetical protein LXA43DRAFT_1059945 [Ganoderma leucocontextum]